jgi:hypothetical protein
MAPASVAGPNFFYKTPFEESANQLASSDLVV